MHLCKDLEISFVTYRKNFPCQGHGPITLLKWFQNEVLNAILGGPAHPPRIVGFSVHGVLLSPYPDIK